MSRIPMDELKLPPYFRFPDRKWGVAMYAAGALRVLAPPNRTVVQAGGCAGFWPLSLSYMFDHVYTFEPDSANFECLRHNIQYRPNITAFHGALSDTQRLIGLTRPRLGAESWRVDEEKLGAGLWKVEGVGDIQAVTLDTHLIDVPVDALVLDIEGHEPQALRGAERTIMKYRPLIWMEFKYNQAELQTWMSEHDYGLPRPGLGNDGYWLPMERQ
jgi:FkbM family methyltransferase